MSHPSVELSVITPIFNEKENIEPLFGRLEDVLKNITPNYEIIVVDDGSEDGSFEKLRYASHINPRIKIISFTRNFGHQVAITAGLEHARGKAIVIIDGDLQDPPELIPELIQKWREGYDVVYTVRRRRKGEGFFKLLTAKIFYRIIKFTTNIPIPLDSGDFRLITHRVQQAILSLPEKRRFVRGIVAWLGFNQTCITYERDERKKNRSKFTYRKMIKIALDGLVSFSYMPLQMATILGGIMFFMSCSLMIFGIYGLIQGSVSLFNLKSVLTLVLFIGGIQLMAIGLLGEYLGMVVDEMKNRPLYIIQDSINIERK